MDPLTAAFNWLASLNNLLLTPPGQKLLDANVTLFMKIFDKIHGRIEQLQGKDQPQAAAPSSSPAK